MTKLLQEAIETLRELPEDEQNAAADVLFAYISSDDRQYNLRPDQAEAVRRIERDLKTGKTRLATDEELASFKKKFAYDPMRLRFTLEALTHIDGIHFYIEGKSPIAAKRILARLFSETDRLEQFPAAGHPVIVPGTREWNVPGLPYIVVYKIDDGRDQLIVLGVFHGARER
jgi:toxin ParE1/3/4